MATVLPFRIFLPGSQEMRPTGLPMPELWDRFEAVVLRGGVRARPYSRSTIQSYRQARRASRMLHDYPCPSEIVLWLKQLHDRGLAHGSVYNHWKYNRALYQAGNDLALVQGNPFRVVSVEKPEPSTRHYDAGDVLPRLLELAPDERWRAALGVLHLLAVRRCEMLGLERRDFYRAPTGEMRCSIVKQRPKPNRFETTRLKSKRNERNLPVPAQLAELVAPLLLSPAHVKIGRGGQETVTTELLFPFREHDLVRMMETIRAALPHAFPEGQAFHAPRHSRSVELKRAGATDEQVSYVLGHTSATTTRTCYIGAVGNYVTAESLGSVWAGSLGSPKSEAAGVGAPAASSRDRAAVPPLTEGAPPCPDVPLQLKLPKNLERKPPKKRVRVIPPGMTRTLV